MSSFSGYPRNLSEKDRKWMEFVGSRFSKTEFTQEPSHSWKRCPVCKRRAQFMTFIHGDIIQKGYACFTCRTREKGKPHEHDVNLTPHAKFHALKGAAISKIKRMSMDSDEALRLLNQILS